MRQNTIIAQRCLPLKSNNISKTRYHELKSSGTDALNILQFIKRLISYFFTALNKNICLINHKKEIRNRIYSIP